MTIKIEAATRLTAGRRFIKPTDSPKKHKEAQIDSLKRFIKEMQKNYRDWKGVPHQQELCMKSIKDGEARLVKLQKELESME